MLQFRPISINDRDWVRSLTKCEFSRSADTSFGAIYLWSAGFPRYVANCHGRMVMMMHRDNGPMFLFPYGCGSLVPVIEEIKEYCDSIGKPFKLFGVSNTHVPLLEKLFPDKFEIIRERRYDDYIYSAEKLSTLSGKALHSKRNHINSFENTYKDWRFEPLKRDNLHLCETLMEQWRDADPEHVDGDVFDEYDALMLALNQFKELDMRGGLLWAGGQPVAFTLGEWLCKDTFVVHFEKARADIRGAYPMINREFVRYIRELYPEIEYINREDDMGLENLRKAKESYKPIMMVEKYTAVWKDEDTEI